MKKLFNTIRDKILKYFDNIEEEKYDVKVELMKLSRQYSNNSWKKSVWKIEPKYKMKRW